MSFTQSDIDALKKALISGNHRVQYKDRSVEYRSVQEMKEILAYMERELAGGKSTRRINPQYDSGL